MLNHWHSMRSHAHRASLQLPGWTTFNSAEAVSPDVNPVTVYETPCGGEVGITNLHFGR